MLFMGTEILAGGNFTPRRIYDKLRNIHHLSFIQFNRVSLINPEAPP